MKSLLCIALTGAAFAAEAQSPSVTAPAPVVAVRPASTQPVTTGSPDTFTGTVRISSPFQALPPGTVGGATVRFDARARTAWHSHPLGQTLIVTDGLGLVQQQGQAAHAIRTGDVITIPANVRHWHGAGPNGSMTHVAVAEKEKGVSVTWQEKVTDQDYQTALTSSGIAARSGEGACASIRTGPTSDILSARQGAIPLIGAFMAASDMPNLRAALNKGLDAGLTVGEAKEVLVQLYAYAGFPRSLNALGELMKLVQARQQRGIHDAPGLEPSRAVLTGSELAVAGTANQTEISGGPVQGAVFDFAPVINQFLQTHLFGDIFERDNLDWQSRELATVGALAATLGAEAQLRSHMRASLRVGLSVAQLQQLIEALADTVGSEAATRARDALQQAIAASKG